jgi:integrase
MGARWVEQLFPRVVVRAPQLVGRDELSLYSYRHALATWVDARYGRATTRRILGHTSRATATDQYLHVEEDTVREAIVAYERELLGEYGQ